MNLLTIVAVLGCLPGCKSAVNMIMFLRFKSADSELISRIENKAKDLPALYDNIFTTYEKSYMVDHLVYRQNNLVGYTSGKCDVDKLSAHITEKLSIGGHKGITVKIFDNESRYLERLESLNALQPEEDRNYEAVFNTVKAICL